MDWTPYPTDGTAGHFTSLVLLDLGQSNDCRDMDPSEQCPEDLDFPYYRKNKRTYAGGVETPQHQYDPSCILETNHQNNNHAANVNNASPNTLAGVSSDNFLADNQIAGLSSNIAAPNDKIENQENAFANAFSSNLDFSNPS